MTKHDRTIPDAPADAAATDVAVARGRNDTRPLGSFVAEQLAVGESNREDTEPHTLGLSAKTSEANEEPKKKFEPWRFAAHTMPPELRKELSEMTLPHADPERLYWARTAEQSETLADAPADQNGSLMPVDELGPAPQDYRDVTTECHPRRRKARLEPRAIGIVVLALGAAVVLGIVALTGGSERGNETTTQAPAGPTVVPTLELPPVQQAAPTVPAPPHQPRARAIDSLGTTPPRSAKTIDEHLTARRREREAKPRAKPPEPVSAPSNLVNALAPKAQRSEPAAASPASADPMRPIAP